MSPRLALRFAASAAALATATSLHAQAASTGSPSMPANAPAASTSAAAPDQAGEPTSTSGQLEDIVVTAQRRSENLQRVPVAVTAVTASALAAKGIESTADLNAVVPGLTYTSVVGTATPRIRGVGTSISLGGNENAVATYVDGVYIASAAASVLSFNNIEQVAVLKGPQGTLFGRNATGGLIQITTRDPAQAFGGMASIGYGNLDTLSGSLYVTGGLTPDVAADLAVYYNNQMDGFGRNVFTGHEVGNGRDLALRSKIKFDIGGDTTGRLSFDYANTRGNYPANRLKTGSRQVNGSFFPGGKFDSNANIDSRFRSEQGGVSLDLRHQFDAFSLVSISAYRRSKLHIVYDIDNLPQALTGGVKVQPDRQFSQELQLVSDGASAFKWLIGGYYFHARSAYDPQIVQLPTATVNIFSRQRTESFAVFGQATIELAPGTSMTGGLRATREDRDYNARSRVDRATEQTNTAPVAGQLNARKLTWRLALDHRFDEDVLGYVSYNRGFKSGGFNPQAVANPLNPFRPETLDAVEGGIKSDLLDRHLRVNSSVFYYKYRDIQLNAFVNGLSSIYNAASARILGLDLDVTAVASRNLTFTGGLSVLDSKFGNFPGAVFSTPIATGGNTLGLGNARGNQLPLTPKWTVNLGADYSIDFSDRRALLSVNYFHSDGWRAEPDNRLRQEAYDLLNASATIFLDPADTYSVKLWGKNLTNTAYAVQMYTLATNDGVNIAPGRTYGATFGIKF